MLKVMTIVGTRPELIKMSRVISELDKHTEHCLVHSGQNYDYELNEVFFNDLEIRKPDLFLGVKAETPSKSIAGIISAADDVIRDVKPDALLLYGDTNTCMSVIAAKRHQVPVFHMEAGNRCFDERVPEELNRKVLDHLSDINLVLTEHARRYLLNEGIAPETVIKTGSHMYEVLNYYSDKINGSEIIGDMKLEPRKFFVFSAHREENVDSESNLNDLLDSLNALAEKYGFPVIVSTHPRTRKRIDALPKRDMNPLIRFLKPLGFLDYIKLQKEAYCVLSDSGTITEESSLLNFPAVTMRNAHERPEGMDEGTLIMSGLKPETILDCVSVVVNQFMEEPDAIRPVQDYVAPSVSRKILRIVLSYTGYVDRTVWRK
ncbi:MAG: UDP-N-acetylglucosamine 2-epimerase (non-hydrolyzing) [Alcanivorax sp.]|jgi:UDP-N-acetylglucosamine 2-epimerase (non-hydrolysing)|uniref:non-hydrolyzing UDP-N-acetylglucosamine 2-epimerase n=1 Tax=unclassified Alcanivorax TaxID=2638842 RepID=UPI000C4AF854|nr:MULTISPECIES: UDP-N-acetylglucosamine 2-epimerase (non-hydrolyzing) [unclassified Alcanivorax]MAC13199.1 UDP-N-acetylglucosamine 2-epimerase (non-hydrolyzing) [Alcanivorax sp.]MBG32231.1 UDP-N-acetylglucosamine 2-epimerase (non-hydrolyzing) [Alcanivorax sp.]|tara:strand:- start:404 stop:1528 length:1125 start_codon:yes stop_codon:yes gene_type:complete